ncbi:MAG: tetratricopeptide repeat protein [Gemmataceae bacterium]|nr:tetratricopeptide repeat protein [Gemmataceae bacterium]
MKLPSTHRFVRSRCAFGLICMVAGCQAQVPPPPLTPVAVQDDRTSERQEQDQRRVAFTRLMVQGATALGAKRFEDAATAYLEAIKLFPNDPDAHRGLAEAQAGLKAGPPPVDPDPKEQERIRQEERRIAFDRLMVQGAAALAAQRYEDAASAYADARKLQPESVEAAKGLTEAQNGLKAMANDQQRQMEVARLVQQGRAAMAAKQFAEAVRSFEQAVQLMPGDAATTKALADARESLAADAAEKRKLADYQEAMTAGRAALVAGRFADAIRDFAIAQRILPGDPAALRGLRDAERFLGALEDREKRRAEYTRLMTQAGAALANKRYDEAIRAYTQAERLFPNDADALQGIRDTQKSAAADVQTEYARLMRHGDIALRAQRFADAIQFFGDALKLIPSDVPAARGLRAAQTALADQQARVADYERAIRAGHAALKQRRFADAAHAFNDALKAFPGDPAALAGLRDTAYTQHMVDGETALRAKRFVEAVKAFEEALKVVPNDKAALAGLKQAQAGIQDVRQAEFDKNMREGNAALKARKFVEAIKEFEEALKISPGDKTALAGIKQAQTAMQEARQAEFDKNMRDGNAAMKARKFAEAIREFEEALKIIPGDKTALAAIKQAQTAIEQAKQADYEKHMRDGNAAMKLKKFAEAIKEFEEALKVKPNDKEAMTALKLARAAMKK